ncbi:hypothetical protein [Pseudomonas sp. Seg1]|uniref:DUF7079 family protein n=1 Tax=Pseudomonas sp. Seg1 TaxID=2678259 RepID=UPI002016DFE3|nr:hypothetical protein [Pseudomonas sp. Seg1]
MENNKANLNRAITASERYDVYWALSDAFVDNEVDYESIARQTEDYDPQEIKRILYEKVAPVCHTNLETVIPMIWSAFNREQLNSDIAKTLDARAQSRLRRQIDKLVIRWLEFRYKYIWREISKYYRQ